jgi:hypothetical protein
MIDALLALDATWRLIAVTGLMLLFGLFGAFLGSFRNRKLLGALLGALLGPVGWLLLFLIQPAYVPCPECNARAHPRWARCPACQCDLQRALQRVSSAQQRAARADWR